MKVASVTILGTVNLKTNERTIMIQVGKDAGRPFLVLEMTPKDFAEALCTHIARPAKMEEIRD